MKKFFILMAAAMMAIGASAQVVTSRTTFKSKSQTLWYVRAGMSINNMAGADFGDAKDYGYNPSMGSKIGAAFDFGFQKPIGKSGLYWSMELGIGSRGFTYSEDNSDTWEYSSESKVSTWNVKYSPIIFGYKYSVTDDLKIDGHFGAFLSYDFAHSIKTTEVDEGESYESTDWDSFADGSNYKEIDAGIQVGIGAWWKKFNIDFTYQRGFIPAFEAESNIDYSVSKLKSSNFMIRVGYAF